MLLTIGQVFSPCPDCHGRVLDKRAPLKNRFYEPPCTCGKRFIDEVFAHIYVVMIEGGLLSGYRTPFESRYASYSSRLFYEGTPAPAFQVAGACIEGSDTRGGTTPFSRRSPKSGGLSGAGILSLGSQNPDLAEIRRLMSSLPGVMFVQAFSLLHPDHWFCTSSSRRYILNFPAVITRKSTRSSERLRSIPSGLLTLHVVSARSA